MGRSLFAMVAVCVAVVTAAAAPAGAEAIRIGGTGGAIPLLQRAVAPFAADSGDELDVVPNLGSSGAIFALANNVLDVVVAARPLNAEEAGLGLVAVPFARTALVFVTSRTEPENLTSTRIVDIFDSANPTWSDGSRISVILRTRLDADTVLMAQAFPGLAAAVDKARRQSHLPVAPTDQDNADMAERMPGSFVQAGLSQIVAEKRALQLIAIDGVAPSLDALESGRYPYEKPFYLVYAAARPGAADKLLAFLRSPPGHQVLRDTGNLPVPPR